DRKMGFWRFWWYAPAGVRRSRHRPSGPRNAAALSSPNTNGSPRRAMFETKPVTPACPLEPPGIGMHQCHRSVFAIGRPQTLDLAHREAEQFGGLSSGQLASQQLVETPP